MQAERFREQTSRRESLTNWQKRELVITVDRVVRARVRMMKNKSSGPKDLFRDGSSEGDADELCL